MTTVYIDGQQLSLRDDQAIGKGGEADVFDIGGGDVLKVFKPPNHPDYKGNPSEQTGARQRIDEHQSKLPQFPKGMPSLVIAPKKLALSGRKKVMGYTMPFLAGTEPILRYAEKSFRQTTGISDEHVVRIFRSLYDTVSAVHDKGVVIGDFNDLNILVKGDKANLIDADSMQFGPFLCRVFTGKFVDPLLCDPTKSSLMLVKPHNELSDWYAYLVMLMQSMLYVGPYGGVFKPKEKAHRVSHDSRSLHRITIWHNEVRYPKPARPMDSLPDLMLDYLRSVFQGDKREVPPIALLNALQFDTSGNLLVTTKPGVTPSITKEIVTGTIRAEKIFETTGRIVFAVHQGGKLRWLYHHNGHYKREDDSIVVKGPLSPNTRFRIAGDKTVMAQGNQALVFTSGSNQPQRVVVDMLAQKLPLIDAISTGLLYVSNGSLKKTSDLLVEGHAETIGDVLPNQTLFWTGEKLGFGFYRAGQLTRHFIFDPHRRGINDSVELPPQSGQLIDSTCVFGREKAWFFQATREGSQSIHRCFLISDKGEVLASAEAQDGDGSWLGTIRGKCAIGDFILAPTDDGVHRVQAQGSQLVVTKEFPDTARVVDSDSQLFPGSGGLMVVETNRIWNVTIS